MIKSQSEEVAPFGTILGITDGGVEVYSCDYPTIDRTKYPNRESLQSFFNGVFTGYRFQCVELARRYLLINNGAIFESIPMAYDIFNLHFLKRVADNILIRLEAHPNDSKILPIKGSLLIWEPHGEFKITGHVAIIIRVTENYVDIVEQNVEDKIWDPNTDYSRRLKARIDSDGRFHIYCTFEDGRILGWMNPNYNEIFQPEQKVQCLSTHLEKVIFEIPDQCNQQPFIHVNEEISETFFKLYGKLLPEEGGKSGIFYALTEKGQMGLKQAAEELHKLFLDATEFALFQKDLLKEYFKIPEALWFRLRKSWFRNRNDLVGGRFDFNLTENGVKVYEYNIDSASGLYETAYTQDQWSKCAGIGHVGKSPSENMFHSLVETWKEKKINGLLHVMHDNDEEEKYHSSYMKTAIEAAGVKVKIVVGLQGLKWNEQGEVVDSDGDTIQNVWKTWSWETVIKELDEEDFSLLRLEENSPEGTEIKRDYSKKLKLADVLLHPKVRVFEPLFAIIPNSKAILPILYSKNINNSLILNCSYELTNELKSQGFVEKPISGRGGENIVIYNKEGNLISRSEGKWENTMKIYQEYCPLLKIDEDFVQVCPWIIKGKFGGTLIRVDKSPIVAYESVCYSLRIVQDESYE